MSISLNAHMNLVYGKPIIRLAGVGIATSSAERTSGNQACSELALATFEYSEKIWPM